MRKVPTRQSILDRVPKSVFIKEVEKVEKILVKLNETDSLEDWSKYTKAQLDDYASKLYIVAQSIPLIRKI